MRQKSPVSSETGYKRIYSLKRTKFRQTDKVEFKKPLKILLFRIYRLHNAGNRTFFPLDIEKNSSYYCEQTGTVVVCRCTGIRNVTQEITDSI